MEKSQFLDEIRRTHAEWEAALAKLDRAQMIKPGTMGEWSIKDLIAHLSWYEREMVGMLQGHALAGSPLWETPLDQRNRILYEENRGRSLQEVRAEAQKVYQELMRELEAIDEGDLQDASRFSGMPADWKPWEVIASNTSEHYPEHTRQVLEWISSVKSA